jgi:hypothetical protein
MKTKIIALVTAGAIAATGLTPTTAYADKGRDAIGLIIGLAALAAIADAANNGNTRVTVSNRNSHRHYTPPRPVIVAPALPRQCLRDRHTRKGWVRVYGKRCMNRFGWTWNGHRWTQRGGNRHSYQDNHRHDHNNRGQNRRNRNNH